MVNKEPLPRLLLLNWRRCSFKVLMKTMVRKLLIVSLIRPWIVWNKLIWRFSWIVPWNPWRPSKWILILIAHSEKLVLRERYITIGISSTLLFLLFNNVLLNGIWAPSSIRPRLPKSLPLIALLFRNFKLLMSLWAWVLKIGTRILRQILLLVIGHRRLHHLRLMLKGHHHLMPFRVLSSRILRWLIGHLLV